MRGPAAIALVAVPLVLSCSSSISLLAWSSSRRAPATSPSASPATAPAKAPASSGGGSAKAAKKTAPASSRTPSGVTTGSSKAPPAGGGSCPSWAAPSASAARPGGIVPYAGIATQLAQRASSKKLGVAFCGDSITQLLEFELADQLKPELAKLKPAGGVGVFGIGGDTTEGLMWRFCNGGLPDASVIVVMIGTNNEPAGGVGMDPATLSTRIAELLKYVRAKRPKAHIISLGIAFRTSQMDNINAVNASVKEAVKNMDTKAYFADWATKLAVSDLADGVHPTAAGWTKILDKLTPFVNALAV